MAETTTATLDERAARHARPAAWSMRSAPRRELPPNLKATTRLAGGADAASLSTVAGKWSNGRAGPVRAERTRNGAGLRSGADSSCTFSGLMACAPGSVLSARSVSGGGLKEETHRQVRFRRWVGNFS